MKVFIVFLGLLIIHVSFLSYQGDMGRYVQCQNYLKAVAEECAAGAALYYDEEAYSNGEFRFYYEEGRKYTESIIKKTKEKMPLPQGSSITYQIEFQDDFLGYEDPLEGTVSGKEDIPSVTVTITADTEDLFHLPFLEERQVIRAAKYELPQ